MVFLIKNSWKLALGVACALFCASLAILVHDSLGLGASVSTSEIRAIAASRPTLFDILGRPMRIKENDYQSVLERGGYRFQPGAKIAMLSPHSGQVAVIDIGQAPTALVQGWSVEPLDHALDRVIQAKQNSSMWLGNDPGLWFQSSICWISIAFFLCMVLLYQEERHPEGVKD